MNDLTTSYPLKVTSRTLPTSRTNKLRVSWFVLGVAFGIGCSSALTSIPFLSSSEPQTAELAPAIEQQSASAELQPAPVVSLVTRTEIAEPQVIEAAPPVPAAEPSPTYPLTVNLKVENGDTFINMLTDTGISYDEASNAVQSIRKVYDPKKLGIGQNITLVLDKPADAGKPVIQAITLPVSITASLEVTRGEQPGTFQVKKTEIPVERKLTRIDATINGSLYETGVNNGLPASLLAEVINAYSYDVDFQRDLAEGDNFNVLYERIVTPDGNIAGYGNVVYAELDLGDREVKIYRYVDQKGSADYYNFKGESVRKALLKTPISGAKITSRFGMRNHPILGYSKMHQGVDFGAPIGTPIYASGDGTVDFVGKRGGYGNYMRIKHNGTYSSAYAHISRFAKGVTPGSKVKQGQIIAYVGMTGTATGPHLHYEILSNGRQVNPSGVKFKTGTVLSGRELANFRKAVEQIEAALKGNEVAMGEVLKNSTAN
jgi:murein DD-endopeptidase MepM/ murein hydrolase activator NlpD